MNTFITKLDLRKTHKGTEFCANNMSEHFAYINKGTTGNVHMQYIITCIISTAILRTTQLTGLISF